MDADELGAIRRSDLIVEVHPVGVDGRIRCLHTVTDDDGPIRYLDTAAGGRRNRYLCKMNERREKSAYHVYSANHLANSGV